MITLVVSLRLMLSTLSPASGVNTAFTYGHTPSGSADPDQVNRNNARVVGNAAARLAGFGESLTAPTAPVLDKIGIDFGYDTTLGWLLSTSPVSVLYQSINYKSCDQSCPDEFWNNATNRRSSAPELPLVDQQGNPTSAKLAITRSFHGQKKVPNIIASSFSFGIDEMPTMAMTDGFTAVRLFSTPRFELRGLDKDETYALTFFGSSSPVDSKRVLKLKVTGRDASGSALVEQQGQAVHANIYRFTDFTGIRPNADGVIKVEVIPDMFSVPFFTSVTLNAMEFYQE